MIIYFSGTGNSLAIARQIAQALNDQVMPLVKAVSTDLQAEKRIGLIYPSYDFNMPPAVRNLVPRLKFGKQAYVFAIIPCGAQAGNSIWTLRHMLRKQGIELTYSHKIRVPDNSAIAFGRNPNDQNWKFIRFADRLKTIITDVEAERRALHFAWFSPLAWLMGTKQMEQWMLRTFRPAVNETKCIGCGICSRVCPMHNISLFDREDNYAQSPLTNAPSTKDYARIAAIGPHCTACLSCVHNCPQQALQLNSKPIRKDYQYRHPKIHTKDLFMR